MRSALLFAIALVACTRAGAPPPDDTAVVGLPDPPAPVSPGATRDGGLPREDEAPQLAVLTEAGDLHLLSVPAGMRRVLAQRLGYGGLACAAQAPFVIFSNAKEAQRFTLTEGPPRRVSLTNVTACEEDTGTGACHLHLLSSAPDGGSACIEVSDGPPSTANRYLPIEARFDRSDATEGPICGEAPPAGTELSRCELTVASGMKIRLRDEPDCVASSVGESASGRHLAVVIEGPCNDYCYQSVLLVDQVAGAVRAELSEVPTIEPVTWQPGGERLLVGGTLLSPSGEVTQLGTSACWLSE